MATLRVRELMTEKVFALHPEDSLLRLKGLMEELDVRHIPIVDHERNLVGLVSQRDLLRHALTGEIDLPINMVRDLLQRTRIADIMITDPECTDADEAIGTAAGRMLDNKYGCLPVVEGARLVGILTESDFVRSRLSEV